MQAATLPLLPSFTLASIFSIALALFACTLIYKGSSRICKEITQLPLANIGAVFVPISLFVFAWAIEFHVHFMASITATFFYRIGQVAIFNSVQNYYIDAFEKDPASAIAATALFRSVIGGVVPLLTLLMLDKYGVG